MPDPLKLHVPDLPKRTRVGLYLSFVLLVATTSGVIFGWPILQSNAGNGGWAVDKYMQASLLVALLSYSGGGFLASVFVVRPLLQRMGLLRTFWIYFSAFLLGGVLLTLSLRVVPELMFPGVILLAVAASCLLNFYYELTPYIEHCNALITVSYSLSSSVFQLTTIPMPPEAGLGIWLVLAGASGCLFYFCFHPYFRHLEDRFEAVNEGELRLLDHDADLDQELVSENVGETIEDQNGGPPVLKGAEDQTPYLLQVQEYCGGIKNLFRSKECWLAGLIVLAIITNQSYFYGTYYNRSLYRTDDQRVLLDAMLTTAQIFGATAGLIVLMNVHHAIIVLCGIFLVFSLSMAFSVPVWAEIVMFFFMTIGSTGALTCCMALSFKYAHTLSAEAFCYFGMILGNLFGPTISFFFTAPGGWSDILCATVGALAFVFAISLLTMYLIRRATAGRSQTDSRAGNANGEADGDDMELSLNHDDMAYLYPFDSHQMSGEIHSRLDGPGSSMHADDGIEISEISAVQPLQLDMRPRVDCPAGGDRKPRPAGRSKGSSGVGDSRGKRGFRSLQDQYAAALSSDARPTDTIPQDIFSWEGQMSPDVSHRSTSSADLDEVNRASDIMWTQRLALRKPRKPQQDRFTEDGIPVALESLLRNAPPLAIPKDDSEREGALNVIPRGSDDGMLQDVLGPRPGGQGNAHRGDAEAGDLAAGDFAGLADMRLDGVIDSPGTSEDGLGSAFSSARVSAGFSSPFASRGARQADDPSSSSTLARKETGKSQSSSKTQLRKEKASRVEKASLAAGGFRRRDIGSLAAGELPPEPGTLLNSLGGQMPPIQDEGLSSDVAAIMGGSKRKRGRGATAPAQVSPFPAGK